MEGDSRDVLLWLFGSPETRLRSVGKIPVMAAGNGFLGRREKQRVGSATVAPGMCSAPEEKKPQRDKSPAKFRLSEAATRSSIRRSQKARRRCLG